MVYLLSDVRIVAAFFSAGVIVGCLSAAIRIAGGLF